MKVSHHPYDTLGEAITAPCGTLTVPRRKRLPRIEWAGKRTPKYVPLNLVERVGR
jgi:hypothetical protein